nr:PREDICTED: keratin, type II cytoskeletal 8-like [Latimeria chalumnae]|eukprot:XP_014347691.1 PREDICTED: keratin, type II cytoskeletal 8-like [Latimeria chalumnae]
MESYTYKISAGGPRYGGRRPFSSQSTSYNFGRELAVAGPYKGHNKAIRPFPALTASGLGSSMVPMQTFTIDKALQEMKIQEKDEIKGLNNKFAKYIDKVCNLEQQNQVLETQLKLLQEKSIYKSNIETLFQIYSQNLKVQLNILGQDKVRLETDLATMEQVVEEHKQRSVMSLAECCTNQGMLDVDESFISKVILEDKLESLSDEIQFLRELYNEELKELQSHITNTAVIVEIDNRRQLDTSSILEDVRAQYEQILKTTKEEENVTMEIKIQGVKDKALSHGEELKERKVEIAEITRNISKISSEIMVLKNQRDALESAKLDVEKKGDINIKNAQEQLRKLEDALQEATKILATHIREYRELMNIKMALDIEITTYRKLLEGEESRITTSGNVILHKKESGYQQAMIKGPMYVREVNRKPISSVYDTMQVAKGPANETFHKRAIQVKTIETKDGHVVSESMDAYEE